MRFEFMVYSKWVADFFYQLMDHWKSTSLCLGIDVEDLW